MDAVEYPRAWTHWRAAKLRAVGPTNAADAPNTLSLPYHRNLGRFAIGKPND
jgi:hypothetical protein